MIDLSTYSAVRTALFVRIQIDEYRTTSSGSYSPVTLAMSDHNANFTIDGTVFTNVGRLMNVTATNSELRSSSNSVTISLSGIPNSAIAEIVNSKIKSAPVDIYRAFFNPSTGTQIGTTQGRFRGFVNNYSLQEDYDVNTRTASNTIILECSSSIDILSRKHTGRRTNPESQKKYFANDLSMDRVPVLENTTFDFGAPK